jgi:hypothetical protein
MKALTVTALLLLAGIVPALGVEFSSVDLKPLIQQHRSTVLSASTLPLGGRSDLVRILTKGGGLIEMFATGSDGPGPRIPPFSGEYLRGVGSAAGFTRFKQALARARVGLQKDCSIALFDEETVTIGADEIIWYGAQGRRNIFTVTYFGPDETPPTPLCPSEVRDMLTELRGYVVSVEQDPDTELLRSR